MAGRVTRGHRVALVVVGAIAAAATAQETRERTQRYLGHGILHIQVPVEWKSTTALDPSRPPTMEFSSAKGDEFKVLLTVIPPPPGREGALAREQLRDSVERSGAVTLSQAVEKSLDVKELKGDDVVGFYASLTDKDPGDSYKYLTQGQARVGTLLAVFTILHRSAGTEIRKAALEMVRTATLSDRPASSSGTASTPTASHPPARLHFTVRDAPWILSFPGEDTQMNRTEPKPDGRSAYFFFTNLKSKVNVSLFIEPVDKCADSRSCRDMILKGNLAQYPGAENVKSSEIDAVSVFEYMLDKAAGVPIRQQNLYAEFVKDGFWVDLHLSKVSYVPEDRKLFEEVVRSVRFDAKRSQ